MKTNSPSGRFGFTLIELMAVIAIVAIMAAILMPRASAARDKAVEKACNHNRSLINAAVERYTVANGVPPSSLADLIVPDYFPEGVPVCPVSGHAYTIDAGTQRVDGHAGGVHP